MKTIGTITLTAIMLTTTAQAEPVNINVAYSSGKLAKQIDCEWRLMDEAGKERGQWYGSRFDQDLSPDRYLFYLNCKHYQGALSFTVKPGKAYIDTITVREY